MSAHRIFGIVRSVEPDHTAFIRSIAPALTEEMLRRVAGSDWGYGVDENLTLLAAIRESGRVSTIGSADPQEVLSLCHWSELAIDAPRREHLIRGFCSAALFQLAEQPEFGDWQSPWMYFSYAQSAIALGYEQAHAALRSIAATIASPKAVLEIPNFGVAALALLAGSVGDRSHTESITPELIQWANRAPSFAPLDCSSGAAQRLDLSCNDHAADRCRWRELARHVSAIASGGWRESGAPRILLPSNNAPPLSPLATQIAEFAARIR